MRTPPVRDWRQLTRVSKTRTRRASSRPSPVGSRAVPNGPVRLSPFQAAQCGRLAPPLTPTHARERRTPSDPPGAHRHAAFSPSAEPFTGSLAAPKWPRDATRGLVTRAQGRKRREPPARCGRLSYRGKLQAHERATADHVGGSATPATRLVCGEHALHVCRAEVPAPVAEHAPVRLPAVQTPELAERRSRHAVSLAHVSEREVDGLARRVILWARRVQATQPPRSSAAPHGQGRTP